MFEELNKFKQEIESFKNDVQKLRENKNSSAEVINDIEPMDKSVNNSLNQQNANPFGNEYDSAKSTAKKATFGCVGCLGVVGIIFAIVILMLSSMCLKSCAKTENAPQIHNPSLMESGMRGGLEVFIGEAAYKDVQTKSDVEKILDSKGFCIKEKEGILSSEGNETCLYFGFASEVRVAYDNKGRVATMSSSNVIPGSQLISILVEWLFAGL